jgi:hypothetical protein
MNEIPYDDTLEVGIAAGLDIPTALVVAQRTRRPNSVPWVTIVLVALGIGLLALFR